MTDGESTPSAEPEPPPIVTEWARNAKPPARRPRPPRRWWRRRDAIEMFVVFVIAVMPPLFDAFAQYISAGAFTDWDDLGASAYLWLIQRSIVVAVPVLYIMWRSRLGWAFFGMGDRPRLRDAIGGLGLLVINYIAYYALYYGFLFMTGLYRGGAYAPLAALSPGADMSGALAESWLLLAILAAAANGFAEEVVMRGYFIPRLEKALGSAWPAVLITAAVFGAYHIYQGLWPAAFAAFGGLVFGYVIVRTRRLWPVAFAHMLMDLIPFVMEHTTGYWPHHF